ncbi:hypothetical protein, partial [Chitinophaga sp.]|uniref:hypothetical protein n=1 Tax=Chitinophaga sp. TaxID=1869181 RepID=UPI002C73BFF1
MKKIFILITIVSTALQIKAQDNRTSIARVISPSPTASSIAKFGEIPVSHYTGVSNIGILIYEIKVNEISVPINLSYHSAGIRVQEEASWVGLGWALFTGGVISRVVNGSDDLKGLGYPNSYLP